MKRFPILFLLLLLFFGLKAQEQKKTSPTDLPDVAVYDVNGATTTLRQLAKNKVLFIDCWFIPCPMCFIAMGSLHKIYAEFAGNKELCFITICMTDSAQVNAFIRQDTIMKVYVGQYQYLSGLNTFTLPVYFMPGCSSKVPLGTKVLSHFAPSDKSKCPTAIFDFPGYPAWIKYDRKGKQVYKELGFRKAAEYETRLTKTLNTALSDRRE